MNLTPKQERFCQEYMIDLNGTKAAIRAGYSERSAESTASEILTYPKVQAKIAELQKTVADKLSINAEWVTQRFKDISDRCMTAEPVMIRNGDGGWMESGEYQFDSSGANKATEMLGKMLGVFEKDNKQKSDTVNQIIRTVLTKPVEYKPSIS